MCLNLKDLNFVENVDKSFITVFLSSLWYCCWNFRNSFVFFFYGGDRLVKVVNAFENIVEDHWKLQ